LVLFFLSLYALIDPDHITLPAAHKIFRELIIALQQAFPSVRKVKNRLLWKSVSLLARYCPSDQLQAIGHRPILNANINNLHTTSRITLSYGQRP
jgi:hypothetical protein